MNREKKEEKGVISTLLASQSVKERKATKVGRLIEELIKQPTAKDLAVTQNFQTKGGSSVREFCEVGTKEACRQARRSKFPCDKVHFRPVLQPHTDKSLGDCSYLNACRHMKTCKFVHYELDNELPRKRGRQDWEDDKDKLSLSTLSKHAINLWPEMYNYPPQWVQCDVRGFKLEILGEFPVIMADPPWDIHMELPYGTLTDDEMQGLQIETLAKAGVFFLWVTGRAMELGRKCLDKWGYEIVGELLWIKTNQLQRLIRTGRTGHWINHSKEHCLIGLKGDPPINHNIDCDVIVSEVRETSRKPDEIYGLLERLAPGARKLEIFGRQHNTRPGWVTLGNQLEGTALADPAVINRWKNVYPQEEFRLIPMPGQPPPNSSQASSSSFASSSDSSQLISGSSGSSSSMPSISTPSPSPSSSHTSHTSHTSPSSLVTGTLDSSDKQPPSSPKGGPSRVGEVTN